MLEPMLKRLVEISRPVLWINTIGTTVMAMWLGGDLWRWDIIPFLIWVTFPFNLLIYGINDIFDQETDNINARKGGMEGAKINPSEVKPIFIGVALTNIPFLIYFAFTVPIAAMGWILAYALFFYFYSSPPFRFKARPVWDSVSNTDYAFPLVFIPLAFGNEPLWFAAIGLMVWSMAKHTFDAVQDIPQDSYVGIKTTAVWLGTKGSAYWVGIFWLISTGLFAMVNIPVAIVNFVIAGYLTYALFKNPVPETGRTLYRLSIAFPYIAGAVAGVQLVSAMVLGLYP
jgi:4-hydroxybenzoate polyprenyltransferase